MEFLTTEQIEFYFIDNRNKDLWNKLSSKYEIYVSDSYQIYRLNFITGSNQVEIHTNTNYSKPIFTHELLHLELREKGLNTFDYFEKPSESLIEGAMVTICNCIEHVLFFDDYIEMGFDREEFTMDYKTSSIDFRSVAKCLKDVKSLNKNHYPLFFYYFYWVIKAEEYTGHNRVVELLKLKNEYPILYHKCESMFDEIIDFEIDGGNVQSRFENILKKYLRRNY